MRNACAHNNCILATLYKKTKKIDPRMRAFIDSLDIDIGNDGKKTRLKCRIISEIVCVLYSLKELASQDVASYDFQEFSNVLKHFEQKYIHHFAQNSLVFANFIFLKKLLTNWLHRDIIYIVIEQTTIGFWWDNVMDVAPLFYAKTADKE